MGLAMRREAQDHADQQPERQQREGHGDRPPVEPLGLLEVGPPSQYATPASLEPRIPARYISPAKNATHVKTAPPSRKIPCTAPQNATWLPQSSQAESLGRPARRR